MIPLWGDRRIPITAWSVYAIVALNVWAYVQETHALHPDALIASFAVIPYDLTHDVVLAAPSPPLPASPNPDRPSRRRPTPASTPWRSMR